MASGSGAKIETTSRSKYSQKYVRRTRELQVLTVIRVDFNVEVVGENIFCGFGSKGEQTEEEKGPCQRLGQSLHL